MLATLFSKEGDDLSLYVVGTRKGLCDFDDNGRITVLRVTQSLIKRLFFRGEQRPDVCPRNIYETLLTGNVQKAKSKALINGIYFETRCLGRGAYESVNDLPRHRRTGKKTTTQENIDEAVLCFKRVTEETGIILNGRNTQVKASKPFTEHNFTGVKVLIEGTADLVSPFTYKNLDYPVCCIDLKLCGDVNNTFIDKKRPWLYYPWGDPAVMDHSQAVLYSSLFEMPFLYLVFDYKKDNAWVPIPIETVASNPDSTEARNRHRELIQDIQKTISKIVLWQEEDYAPYPCDTCNDCPVYNCEIKRDIRFI